MYELGRAIFIGGLILSIIMLIVSVVLFFILRIPSVFGDLTGSTARKAIANIHTRNQESQHKVYNTATLRKERKISERISERLGRTTGSTVTTGALKPPPPVADSPVPSSQVPDSGETSVLAPESGETSVLAPESGETSVLAPESGETSVLSPQSGETSVLTPEYGETSVLTSNLGETSVLSNAQTTTNLAFSIEYDITYVHSNEIVS